MAEWAADLHFPALTGADARSETQLSLVTSDRAISIVAVSQARAGMGTAADLTVLRWKQGDSDPDAQIVRRVSLPSGSADGLWTVRYEHGLVCVSCSGKPLVWAFPGIPGACVMGVGWDQKIGKVTCRLLRLAAAPMPLPPSSADGLSRLQEAHQLNETGKLLFQGGAIENALAATRKASTIYQAVLGDAAVDTANSFVNIATLLQRKGDHHAAQVQWQQALGIYRKVLGETHPTTAQTRVSLALLLAATGQLTEAESYLDEALPVYTRVFGPDDSTTATLTQLLATIQKGSKTRPRCATRSSEPIIHLPVHRNERRKPECPAQHRLPRKGWIMGKGLPFPNVTDMPGRLTGLLISMAVLAFTVTSSRAADPGEQGRLEHDVAEAAANFVSFCSSPEVWRFDNLRPTVLRAVAPIGSIFHPPEVPVVHLSPGSPDYRKIVGQMMYLFSLYVSRRERLAEFLAEQKAGAPPPPPQRARAVLANISSAADIEIGDETHRVENELDHARASYGRACAWGWPYINLRPMCHTPGFEAATILNPFLPVPKIRLSEASQDYKVIVAAMNHWEPKIPNAKARLKDLLNDQKSADSAAAAVAAAAPKGKPPDKKVTPEDGRLAQMFEIYEQLKPALKQWRKDQYDLEMLAEPWYLAKCTLVTLQAQALTIQQSIFWLQQPHDDSHDPGGPMRRQIQIQALQTQLAQLAPQIARAQYELGKIENQIDSLRREQASLAGKTDAAMEKWGHLCDALGRLGPVAHHKALPLFDQWIAEEPRLWQSYLARGVARLHAGRHTLAIEDFRRVDSKLRLYGSRPSELALITALEAYALCKQNETRDGCKLFAEAKKLDRQSWVVCQVRGWSNLEQKKYSAAKSDFQMALSLSKKRPGRAARGDGAAVGRLP